jgi:suppressor of G2 allele of SKP1
MENNEDILFISALSNYMKDNFKLSLNNFTELIEKYKESKNLHSYLLYSAICNNKLKKYEEAKNLIEKLESDKSYEKTFNFFFVKGIILFNLNIYVDSKINFTEALHKINASDTELKNKLIPWINKVDIELKESGVIEYNKANPTELRIIYNWIQTPTSITVDITSNNNMKEYDIKINKKNIEFINKLDGKVKYSLDLTNGILPEKSTFNVSSAMKVKLELKKEIENFNWVNLEINKDNNNNINAVNNPKDKVINGYYPSSSKIKKDWNQLDKEIEKELKEDTKDSNEGMWNLFRQIYEQGDEDRRRAMIKSFQTSGGTVLSTDWNDVKTKDYEGKDRPEAPKGQEWAKKE